MNSEKRTELLEALSKLPEAVQAGGREEVTAFVGSLCGAGKLDYKECSRQFGLSDQTWYRMGKKNNTAFPNTYRSILSVIPKIQVFLEGKVGLSRAHLEAMVGTDVQNPAKLQEMLEKLQEIEQISGITLSGEAATEILRLYLQEYPD